MTTRNLTIVLGILFGCLIILGLLWVGWSFFAPPPLPVPTSTVISSFVTPTPSANESPTELSPTPSSATVTPSPTVILTLTPTLTPRPTNTPTPIPSPHAVINSPNGFINIRSGPGTAYNPPLGTYSNGTVADVIGKQYAPDGSLWWLISFPAGPYGQGWVYANYTTAQNVDNVPWVTAPSTPTPVFVTPTLPPQPQATINSPDGFLYVRTGPGWVYQPSLGAYNNGAVVDIIGRQLATDGALWWLVPFAGGPNGQGWIYANYTIARHTNNVPWITAPPTPTLAPTRTPIPTLTPIVPPIVVWTITGRVIDATTVQPIVGASIQAKLGHDGNSSTALTDGNGDFSIVAQAHDDGNLILIVTALGYMEETITAGAIKPRVYKFPAIELFQQQAPTVTWVVLGRVVEIGTTIPIPNAYVEAILGDDAVRLDDLTDANGEFSMNGQARDSGFLSLNINADGYQLYSLTSEQIDSRVYNLSDLSLVPLAGSCPYESVINLSQTTALARLQSLSFTSVSTTSVAVGGNENLIDLVLTQDPSPPPEGQSKRLSCQIPINLGIGVGEENQ